MHARTYNTCISSFISTCTHHVFPFVLQGKGKMNTYWLVGRDGFEGVLPDFTGLSAGDSPRPTPMPVTTGKRVYAKKAPISSVTGSSEFSPPDADNNPGSSRDITEVSV